MATPNLTPPGQALQGGTYTAQQAMDKKLKTPALPSAARPVFQQPTPGQIPQVPASPMPFNRGNMFGQSAASNTPPWAPRSTGPSISATFPSPAAYSPPPRQAVQPSTPVDIGIDTSQQIPQVPASPMPLSRGDLPTFGASTIPPVPASTSGNLRGPQAAAASLAPAAAAAAGLDTPVSPVPSVDQGNLLGPQYGARPASPMSIGLDTPSYGNTQAGVKPAAPMSIGLDTPPYGNTQAGVKPTAPMSRGIDTPTPVVPTAEYSPVRPRNASSAPSVVRVSQNINDGGIRAVARPSQPNPGSSARPVPVVANSGTTAAPAVVNSAMPQTQLNPASGAPAAPAVVNSAMPQTQLNPASGTSAMPTSANNTTPSTFESLPAEFQQRYRDRVSQGLNQNFTPEAAARYYDENYRGTGRTMQPFTPSAVANTPANVPPVPPAPVVTTGGPAAPAVPTVPPAPAVTTDDPRYPLRPKVQLSPLTTDPVSPMRRQWVNPLNDPQHKTPEQIMIEEEAAGRSAEISQARDVASQEMRDIQDELSNNSAAGQGAALAAQDAERWRQRVRYGYRAPGTTGVTRGNVYTPGPQMNDFGPTERAVDPNDARLAQIVGERNQRMDAERDARIAAPRQRPTPEQMQQQADLLRQIRKRRLEEEGNNRRSRGLRA